MSIGIAGERDWNQISKEDFLASSELIGISPRVIGREYDRLAGGFEEALHAAAEELDASGLRHCRELADTISALRRA